MADGPYVVGNTDSGKESHTLAVKSCKLCVVSPMNHGVKLAHQRLVAYKPSSRNDIVNFLLIMFEFTLIRANVLHKIQTQNCLKKS